MTTFSKTLQNINDYELLYMIRQSDDYALQLLLKKYDAYLWSLIKEYFEGYLPGLDREDLHAMAYLKVLDAIEQYNEEKGCSFCTYLTLCVTRRLNTLRHVALREKKRYYPGMLSLDAFTHELGGSYIVDTVENNQQCFDPDFYVQYQELLRKIRLFIDELSPIEMKVWDCMMKNYSYQEAASRLGMKKKSYDNSVFRIRKKLQKYLKM